MRIGKRRFRNLDVRHVETGHPHRFGLQGRINDGGDLIYFIEGLSSPAWSNVPQTVNPLLIIKALPPQNHRIAVHRKLLRNSGIRLPCAAIHCSSFS